MRSYSFHDQDAFQTNRVVGVIEFNVIVYRTQIVLTDQSRRCDSAPRVCLRDYGITKHEQTRPRRLPGAGDEGDYGLG
jgi:hypothetical protein